MSHTPNPTPNPINPEGTVCADCGAPLARVNAGAARAGWKHYAARAAYRAQILELLEDARVERISNEIDGVREDGITPVLEDGWTAPAPRLEIGDRVIVSTTRERGRIVHTYTTYGGERMAWIRLDRGDIKARYAVSSLELEPELRSGFPASRGPVAGPMRSAPEPAPDGWDPRRSAGAVLARYAAETREHNASEDRWDDGSRYMEAVYGSRLFHYPLGSVKDPEAARIVDRLTIRHARLAGLELG